MGRRTDVPALRAAWWTHRALRHARRQLRSSGLEGLELPAPPEVPASARRGVRAVLRRRSATCLERALVLQRWRAAHGDPQDVVIGVKAPGAGFAAHAWLADEAAGGEQYAELLRVSP
jgi:hypothetical protein